jgi:hypothetical protein
VSAQDDYVKNSLDILREMQISGMSAEDRLTWQGKIDDVKRGYDEARAIEKDEKRTAEERKRAKDVGDAIAKAAPAITKSVISAIDAFSKGDAINGSADILDICASLAPLIGAFLSAAGPEGAVVGAVFSIVAQILRCFGAKGESDVAKLEKFLEELKAQTELESIRAVHDAVLTYATTLLQQAASLQTLLAKPLRNHEDYKAFFLGLEESKIVLSDTNPHSSVAMFTQWEVLEYLANSANQDVALWPTVLGIYCKTYSDLVTSTMTITAMANTDDMRARLQDVDPDITSNLSPQDRRDLEKKMLRIQAYAAARKVEYESCNARVLETLKKLTGAAQRWGLYAHVGTTHGLYVTSGPKKVKDGGWTGLSDANYYHRLIIYADAAATIHTGQASSQFNFKPDYHCFVLKSTSDKYPGSHHWVDHMWVNASTMAVNKSRNVLDNFDPPFADVCAVAETDKKLTVFAGIGAPRNSVIGWSLNAKDGYNTAKLESENWWPPTKAPVTTIRVVVGPVSSIDDPDVEAIPPGWRTEILYASMHGTTDIYVNTNNQGHYIPVPAGWGEYTGIAVDQTYLWLYHTLGFAVVSHASVLSYLHGDRPAPRWMLYPSLPSDLLGDRTLPPNAKPMYYYGNKHDMEYGKEVGALPALLGLVSLSPCEDGTILAAVVHRTIVAVTPVVIPRGKPSHYWNVFDEWTIQTAPYEVDVAQGTLSIDPQSWTKIRGEALHVQKLPMPGWALFKNLMAKLG